MKYLKASLIFLMLFSLNELEAQIQKRTTTETEEVYCRNSDYQFIVEGNYYFDNNKVYVCPINIPFEVTLVDAENQNPVLTTMEWRINGSISTETENSVSINTNDFNDDKVKLTCQFTESSTGNLIDIELRLIKDIKLKFPKSDRNFAYDDNKEQLYIDSYSGTEALGTPWIFLPSGTTSTEIVEAKVSKKKGYYAINNISSNNSTLSMDPTGLSDSREEITFEYTGAGDGIIEVKGCHDIEPELLIYTETPKVFQIEFFILCESDDDIQVVPVGETVNNSTDVCIDGGVDKTIDGMFDPSFRKGDDQINFDSDFRYYLVAGENLICETKANPAGEPDCPSSYNIEAAITATNNIMRQVGVTLEMVENLTTINYNYDIFREDRILEFKEQKSLHKTLYGGGPPEDGITKVYIVKDLGLTENEEGIMVDVLGRATLLGLNTLSIDTNDANPNVLPHELGHAKWALEHPYHEFNITNDYDNFMHRVSTNVENWNIRRYQFHLLHK